MKKHLEQSVAVVRNVLDADDIGYSTENAREDDAAFQLHIWGENYQLSPIILIRNEELSFLVVVVPVPFLIHERRRSEIIEAVVRINNRIIFGKFSMDHANNLTRFESIVPLPDCSATEELVRNLLYLALAATDRYAPAFARLMYDTELSAIEAVAEVEMAAT